LLDHLLYSWLVQYLQDTYDIKEAAMIASVSSYVIPVILSAGIIWTVYQAGIQQWWHRKAPPPEVTKQSEIRYLMARNDALKITLGETSEFEHTQPRSDYVIRTVLACVENIDTSHFISNCEASVEINGIDHPLVECFTLNPIERRFIPIAKRHESPIDNFIHIWALPKPGGIGGIQFRPKLPLSGGFITIKAMSTETRPAQLVCHVFVDDSGKLKLEKA
jgi:hypothetical protein